MWEGGVSLASVILQIIEDAQPAFQPGEKSRPWQQDADSRHDHDSFLAYRRVATMIFPLAVRSDSSGMFTIDPQDLAAAQEQTARHRSRKAPRVL